MIEKGNIKSLFKVTLISIGVFSTLTLLSYLYYLEVNYRANFKLGFPYIFYYQFGIDCEVQHGGNGRRLMLDYILTWAATFFIHKIKINKSK